MESIVPAMDLQRMTRQVFESVGVPVDQAEVTARILVDADLRGVHSHGTMRLNVYPSRIQAGGVSPIAHVEVVKESTATALLRGGNGLGQVVAHRSMETAIAMAKSSGAAFVGVRESNHFGPASFYAEMAANENMVGLVTTVSSVNVMAPAGGAQKLLGNNPIAIAAPWKPGSPLLLDMALSVAAVGRIKLAAYSGEEIPEGWALDTEGNPTKDPQAALEGLAAPVGGYKGSGLAIMLAVIAGALTGGALGSQVRDIFKDLSSPQNTSHAFLAVDIESLCGLSEFAEAVARFANELKNSKRAPDVEEILMPGEREARLRASRLKEGIPLNSEVLQQICSVASDLGVEPVVIS